METTTVRNSPKRGIIAVRAESREPDLPALMVELGDTVRGYYERTHRQFAELSANVDDFMKSADMSLLCGGGGLGRNTSDLEIAAFLSATQRRAVTKDEASGVDLSGYNEAFSGYLRFGENGLAPDLRAEMSVGSDPDGGYFVAPVLAPDIKKRLFETSAMRSLTEGLTLTGSDSLKIPLDVNDAVTGGFVGETEARPDTGTPEVGEQEIFLREQYANPRVTQKLLDMSSFGVEMWLARKIGEKMGRIENNRFVVGTGVKAPRGFLDYKAAAVTTDDASRAWGILQYVPTGLAGAFPAISGLPGATDADSLIDIQSKLKPDYRADAVWVMNRATGAVIRKMKDGNGRFLWVDALIAGQPPLLLGSPVVSMEDMPDIAADSFSVAYGDFGEGYQILDGPGIRVLRDPFTTKGYVKFYTTKWVGGDVADFDAIKLLKFAVS